MKDETLEQRVRREADEATRIDLGPLLVAAVLVVAVVSAASVVFPWGFALVLP